MHGASEDGRENEVWRRPGRGEREARVERFTDFLLSQGRSFRDEETGVGAGKCSSDIVFPFRSTKTPWSNFANATKSGRGPYLLVSRRNIVGNFCARREASA